MYILYTLLKVVGYYDLDGGWVGVVSYIQVFWIF